MESCENYLKVIKSLITTKSITLSILKTLSHDKNTMTNPHNIANIVNNSFASAVETAKQNIKFSCKHFSDYLKNLCSNSFFIQSTDCAEIANMFA